MSSSPRRAPVQPSALTPQEREPAQALPFPYGDVAGGGKRESATGAAAAVSGAEREAQARALGRQEGEIAARAKFEEQLGRERAAIAKALGDFARDRASYYQKVEAEAVQLALSIARKVLHREAQVDPLLLMGIVRVALEQIEGATGVTLVVAAQQAAEWRKYLASHMEPAQLPEFAEDAALSRGACQLRTSMGTAEIGLEVQLKEIEKGLMDLLAARPQERPEK